MVLSILKLFYNNTCIINKTVLSGESLSAYQTLSPSRERQRRNPRRHQHPTGREWKDGRRRKKTEGGKSTASSSLCPVTLRTTTLTERLSGEASEGVLAQSDNTFHSLKQFIIKNSTHNSNIFKLMSACLHVSLQNTSASQQNSWHFTVCREIFAHILFSPLLSACKFKIGRIPVS